MTHQEIRKKFLEFFEKRGHKVVPSSSLIPDDPSVLFTTAGMQQFKKYYLDSDSPYGNRVASIQKCIRTTDIDEVGDESHLTFFEMLGNFSFKFPEGEDSYFKEEAIKLGYDFIIGELKIPLARIKISVFGGAQENNIPADTESLEIWKKIGIPEDKIFFGEGKDNFWGPTGDEGPCGPTTEIYADGVEVWNIVFNEYYCDKEKRLAPLGKKGVDTGMGLERLAMVVQARKNVFETDLFEPIVNKIKFGVKNPLDTKRSYRIIADHLRASVFLISDGLKPSNKDQGYILRRLIRRATMHAILRDDYHYPFMEIFDAITDVYKNNYPELDTNRQEIETVLYEEVKRFSSRIKEGEEQYFKFDKKISGREAFLLQQSYGFPIELIRELAKRDGKEIDEVGFEKEMLGHQEKSRAGAGKKFKK